MHAEELVRMHIGNLIVQIAGLQAENETLKAELAKYKAAEKDSVDGKA